jgi:Immunity protein 26
MKKLVVQSGDVFLIPLEISEKKNGYVIGRVISDESVNAHLVEIFSHFYADIPTSSELKDLSSRLFRPVFLKFLFTKIDKWKVVSKNPNFHKNEVGYDSIKIAFDASIPPKLWQGGKLAPTGIESLRGLEPSIVWFPEKIVKRIAAHVRGDFGPEDVYPA